jgi:alpha-aminoadipic semialdehyde synthase
VVSDISCDVHGGIEFLERSTTIDQPSFQYDPITGKEATTTTSDSGSITVMGVDILPTELPLESSTHFGNAVRDLLDEFVHAKKSTKSTTNNGVLDIDKLSPRLVRVFRFRI